MAPRNRSARRPFRPVLPPDPSRVPDETIVELEDAIVTEFSSRAGPRKSRQQTRGAVYTSDGLLVPESQRAGGVSGDHVTADDPPSIAAEPTGSLTGTWLYAGNWMAHFGHFITETLTTLWPRERQHDGVLAHPYVWRRREPSDAQLRLFEAAGFEGRPVIIGETIRVERLLVPSRPFVTNAVAGPAAVRVWDRVAARAPSVPSDRVFLSRSAFHSDHLRQHGEPHKRALENECELDGLMRSRGFDVVHPEELDVLEQVAVAAGAAVLAGSSGSALHLAAFAGEGTRVLELGDPRSPAGLPNQHVIAAARGHQYAAVPHASAANGGTGIDLTHVRRELDRLGLSRVRRWRSGRR